MTISPSDLLASGDSNNPAEALALAVAAACGTVLPASEQLSPGAPRPGDMQFISGFAAAASVELTGAISGRLTVLVGDELVTALASSPLGGLDLAAAVQPALDAAAAALSCSAQAARRVELSLVVDELAGPFTAVPMMDKGLSAALLVPDATLAQALAAAGAAGGPGAAGHLGSQLVGSLDSSDDNVRAISDGRRGIEMLHGVEMEVTVELGRTRMAVRDLLALAPGTVLALDRAAGSPADLLVNGRLIARGEVVVIDEDFGLRVTEILDHSAVS